MIEIPIWLMWVLCIGCAPAVGIVILAIVALTCGIVEAIKDKRRGK